MEGLSAKLFLILGHVNLWKREKEGRDFLRTDEGAKWAFLRRQSGASAEAIAIACGVSYNTVRLAIRRGRVTTVAKTPGVKPEKEAS